MKSTSVNESIKTSNYFVYFAFQKKKLPSNSLTLVTKLLMNDLIKAKHFVLHEYCYLSKNVSHSNKKSI